MSGADYLVYDVFTATAFGGNQLAVFPDAQGLPDILFHHDDRGPRRLDARHLAILFAQPAAGP